MKILRNRSSTALQRCVTPWIYLAMIWVLTSTPAVWANQADKTDDMADGDAVHATQQVIEELQRFENAPANNRAARRNALVKIVAQRRERMLKLMERNPKLAVSRLMPKELRNRLPADMQDLVEHDVNVSGELRAEIGDDFKTGRSHTRFYLRTPSESLDVNLAEGEANDLLEHTSKKVSLAAARLNGRLLVRNKQDIKTAAMSTSGVPGSSPNTSSSTLASSTSAVTGQKRVLVMLLNFPNQAVECTAPEVASRVFGATGPTANRSYVESSRGQLGLTGDVIGPFTIPYGTPNTCNKDDWANAADNAARTAGIDLSQYDLRSYALPRTGTVCPWDGLADIGNPRSWTKACMSTRVIAHELGHNLSFNHADTPTEEYADLSDPMSKGGWLQPSGSTYIDHSVPITQFNGANRVIAGWVPGANIQHVLTNGSYALNAIELTDVSGTQALRLYKVDTKEWYYVTLRKEIDLDANLAQFVDFLGIVNGVPQIEPKYTDRIQIHRASAVSSVAHTYLLANLRPGESFVDTVNGIAVTHQTLVGNTATINVALTGPTCARKAPTVTISPSSQVGSAGGALKYNLNIRNNDTPVCGPNSFVLSQTLPAGFTGMFHHSSPPGTPPVANDTYVIEPSSFALANWTVTAPSSAAIGSYTLRATATELATGATPASTQATFNIFPIVPTLAITSPVPNAILSGIVQLSATASHPSGIAAVEFYLDNTLITRLTSSPYRAPWVVGNTTKGPHVIRVKAISTTGISVQSQVNVTVQ